MEIELNIPETEITGKDISVETENINIAVSEDIKDLDITYNRKEYCIIGDGIFMPSMYENAPPWLKEFIDTTISVAVINRDQSLIDRMEAILTLMDYVPKNQYTEQINQIISEDGIINSRIATLNSNLTYAISSTNATIAEINLTYASKDEAAAIAINALTASLSGSGEIGSTLIQLQEAYAYLESTTAQSISILESVMEGEINSNATAMETIRTYVGIDEAGAGTGTGLSAYLEASDGTIGGADSQLANDVRVTAEGVESKFAYNSIVNINGVYKRSGFGLTTNYTSGAGTQANPYVSEFWIDASRFKFTNSNQTGRTAPFTIDATGATPSIRFNGIVNFTNTNIANGYPGTVKINGGLLEANTVTANKINTVGLIAENISANEIVGKTIIGGNINGARINAAIIKASYLDLNGELEVLTNYIISVATYNANPSLYTDSVYIAADNQYRIPTLSLIRETAQSATYEIGQTGSLTGVMWAYNKGNAGSNLKAVKIQPTFTVSNNSVLINSEHSWYVSAGDFIYGGTKNRITISLAGIELFRYNVEYIPSSEPNRVTLSGPLFGTIDLPNDWIYYQSPTYDCNIGIGILRVKLAYKAVSSYIDENNNTIEKAVMVMTGTLLAGDRVFPYYWQDSSRLVISQVVAPYGGYAGVGNVAPASSTILISSNIMINNMV